MSVRRCSRPTICSAARRKTRSVARILPALRSCGCPAPRMVEQLLQCHVVEGLRCILLIPLHDLHCEERPIEVRRYLLTHVAEGACAHHLEREQPDQCLMVGRANRKPSMRHLREGSRGRTFDFESEVAFDGLSIMGRVRVIAVEVRHHRRIPNLHGVFAAEAAAGGQKTTMIGEGLEPKLRDEVISSGRCDASMMRYRRERLTSFMAAYADSTSPRWAEDRAVGHRHVGHRAREPSLTTGLTNFWISGSCVVGACHYRAVSYVSEQSTITKVGNRYATRIREKTRGRIQSYLQSRADWNLSRSLKNLVEQAVRDYEHRALVELLQNAHDAHEAAERAGRVLIRLDHDEGEHGVLYVANTGSGFTDSNFDAITDVAQSDKRPEEGIGNKGIGFKSVLQLSRVPEIYSTATDDLGGSGTGYCFGFATMSDLVEHLEQLGHHDAPAVTASEVERDVFHLCLPVALRERPSLVDTLFAAGYVTVVRLPLKSEEARAEAAEQLRLLTQGPPALLFLRRIARLALDEVRDGQISSTALERTEAPLAELADITVARVSLSDTDTYLIAEKAVPPATFADAIARSIAGDHISERWADWTTEAHVAVAVRLDAELDAGRLYTYLPMGEEAHAPLPAHVNAPFFAKLARVNLEQSVPLNDMLLDQVAELCARLLLAAPEESIRLGSEVLIDLLAWTASSAARLRAAFERLGSDAATAPVVPLAAPGGGWASLSDAFAWDDIGRKVLTVAQLRAHAGVPVVVTGLSKQRVKRLEQTARALAARRLAPTEVDIAGWAERIAHSLATQPFDADTWGIFYDELAPVIRDRQVLFGRKILIDDDRKVRACNTKTGDGKSPVAFFSPRADASDRDGQDADLRPPSRLRRRVFFVSRQITWNRRNGAVLTKRPGRGMLEDGLVHEYRATDLLPVVASALERRPTPELAAEVLIWTYRFASSREEPPWRDIRNMRLLVPVRDGQWVPAERALLSEGWGGDEDALLDELLSHSSDLASEFGELRGRLTIEPTDAPFHGFPPQRLREFLVHIGVRAGLYPDPVPQSTLRGAGHAFESGHGLTPTSLPAPTASTWRAAIAQRLPSGLRPFTEYRSQTPLYRLPGQDDHAEFPAAVKMLYARLVALGLSTWPEETLNVAVHRYNDTNDRFTLPTPVAAFLTQNSWVPVTAPGDRTTATYVHAGDAWSHLNDAPPFAPVIAPQVRRLLQRSENSEARAQRIGIRNWDDPATAADRVRLLATLLESGQVPDTVLAQFRSAYENAWIGAVAASPGGTPLDSDSHASIVVTRGSLLDVIDLRAGDDTEVVYVQDTDARQNVQLLEQCAAPVLRLRHTQAAQVAARLEQAFGARIRRVSEIDVTVRVDDRPFTASADAALLTGPDRPWLVDLVAAVIELRPSRFRRTGAEALRRTIARLRRLHLVLADTIETDVDGHTVVASHAGTRWLAISDEENPTVIVQRRAKDDDMRVLERASTPVAEILGYPELGDTIRVALNELTTLGYNPTHPPGTDALAEALAESPQRIDEIRQAIRRPDDIALDVLVPLVAVWDLAAARELEAGSDAPPAPNELVKWLIAQSGSTADVNVLLTAAADKDLNRARQALGIELRRLNAAIQQLGMPYQELKDSDAITQQFRHFVTVHTTKILEALRQAFLDDYRAGKPLDRYLTYRELTTLVLDPTWAEDHLVVPDEIIREHVNRWLDAAGAQPLGDGTTLEPVDALRRDNRTHVLNWVSEAVDIIRAYEHTHKLPESNLPGDAVEVADALAGAGLLDFERFNVERFLAWLQSTSRWPAGMPLTLDATGLGLTPTALERAEREREEARKFREDSRRRITIDGLDMVAEETNYAKIVAAVKAGMTQTFLATRATSSLNELPPAVRQRSGTVRSGTTAARRPTTSAAQAAAIGLAGEVAALEWVKARYPGVTDLDAWKSGYRNQVLGDADGDDTLGYDIVVDTDKQRIMFEVKATSDDTTEFHLTNAEIMRARNLKRHERYQILFVTHALDSNLRRIHLLPNPLQPRNARFYRTVGDGIRYRFDITTPSE